MPTIDKRRITKLMANEEAFEGTVQSVYIRSGIGGFRPQILDEETGQCLSIDKEGLVRVERTSDATVRSESGESPKRYVGGTETARLTEKEREALFEIIGNLFRKGNLIGDSNDGPHLKVILTNTEGKEFTYSGWTHLKRDGGFSKLLRQYSGIKYLKGLDGRPKGACRIPFKKPEGNDYC